MIVGIDYQFNQSFGVYKQALYQTVQRANQLGASRLDLAFTAELVKKKVGAQAQSTWAFVQMMDTYHFQVIDAMSQNMVSQLPAVSAHNNRPAHQCA